MKKINKYRPNNNNFIYSLNYKFDSCSIAGKINGTALELIKRYNDFAKEAQGNGDYINAEIFRQYAEHYRKIVTEINERKAIRNSENAQAADKQEEQAAAEENAEMSSPLPVAEIKTEAEAKTEIAEEIPAKTEAKRSFQVIEISTAKEENAEPPVRTKRVYRKKSAS